MSSINQEKIKEGRPRSVFSSYHSDKNFDVDETEEVGLREDIPPWDVFKSFPTQTESGSMQNSSFFENTVRVLKVFIYGLLFVIVLCSAIVAKLTILFAASQLHDSTNLLYCNDYDSRLQGNKYMTEHTQDGRVKWIWCLIFIFMVPECIGVLKTVWHYLFKKKSEMPRKRNMVFMILVETLHTVGLVLLVFVILPEISAVQGAAIFCCLCFIPGLLNLLSRNRENQNLSTSKLRLYIIFDALALVAQISGSFIWPLIHNDTSKVSTWISPIALVLCSIRWWGNYVSSYSNIGFVRYLSSMKENLQPSRHIIQGYASLWRIFIFITGAFIVSVCNSIDVKSFFSPKLTTDYKINLIPNASLYDDFFFNVTKKEDKPFIMVPYNAPLYIFTIQAASAMIMYQSCKFAYRTHMHQFGFAFPINLANPGAVCLIVALCTARNQDPCAFHGVAFLLDYLFFRESVFKNWGEFFTNDKWYVWLWPIWMISQLWITMHLWTTQNERLALAERIFSIITYDSLMIDQCLAMNRRTQSKNAEEDEERNKNSELTDTDLIFSDTMFGDIGLDEFEQDFDRNEINMAGDKRKDRVTKIYACATMWHEEKSEMNHLVGSILRLDKDQCAMRITQHHYEVRIKDYYELQTHIFFDDAFCCMHGCVDLCNHDEDETEVNHYVMTLVETVQKNVENLGMRASPPTKYPTPYGGRLVWRLPGETELIVHLKDKNKIRHRKRWSQVMYMYYLLGYRLMGLPIDVDRKEIIAENTYILTLDGDIDFRPAAVKILVDLMKKDKDLAAACGRIHPVGSGPIVWFQTFEYAIGQYSEFIALFGPISEVTSTTAARDSMIKLPITYLSQEVPLYKKNMLQLFFPNGHWLQKSTEHTIGSVLCSPGCFSLFRAKALMQHNVMAKYATKSSEARHYIQYDQGEDRWLCTLLLQVGSRVEYSAASDAYTHAPEIFRDFYIQRRRWIPSTVANIFDLLLNSKETRKVNNDFSWLYIAYQWILMGSTILGPGTIFLMLVGAFVAAFHIDNWTSFWYNLIPICTFIGVCFTCKERMQLLVAEIISVVYGLVMVIVLVGIMLQIAEDGWLAPSSLLFFIVAGQLIIAGLLHPQEATCLLCGIIYYITVPSMYMLLIIFSVFNVHNVTWGTRDSKKPTVKPQDETRPAATSHLPGFLTGKWNKEDNNKKGSLEFSLGDLFKCVCCIHTGISYEEKRLIEINDSLQKINKHLDLLDRLHATKMETSNAAQSSSDANIFPRPYLPEEEEASEQIELPHMANKSDQENESYEDIDDESDVLTQASTVLSHERSSFLISPYWLQDERTRRGDVNFLSNLEEEFWKNLIGKYLRPIETDEESQNKIVEELISCRDAYLLKFFMINALFVLIVFLMQLNKDTLHLQWPLSMKYNVTYDAKRDEVHLGKEYLRLEPIGCLFIAAFVSILGIQFCAMLVHRFNTLSHVLANTRLPFCTKTSEDDNFQKYVDLIAQEVQRMADDNLTFQLRRSTMTAPRRRRTVHELTENPQGPLRIFGNWGKLFRGMLHDTNKSGLSRRMSSRMSKSEFNAIERRRSSLLERGKTQTQKAYDIYDDTDNSKRPPNHHTSQPSTSNFNQFQYDNPTFKRDENI